MSVADGGGPNDRSLALLEAAEADVEIVVDIEAEEVRILES